MTHHVSICLSRWFLEFRIASEDIALRMAAWFIRDDKPVDEVVRSTKTNGQWATADEEETDGEFPFKAGQRFEVSSLVESIPVAYALKKHFLHS